jgi:hypothetical protein
MCSLPHGKTCKGVEELFSFKLEFGKIGVELTTTCGIPIFGIQNEESHETYGVEYG